LGWDLAGTAFFAHGHINGHHYRAPLRNNTKFVYKAANLVAYESSSGPDSIIHFGNLVGFAKAGSGMASAVIERRLVQRQSVDPFYVCVRPTSPMPNLVLVPVVRFICACSEMCLRLVVPPVSMVIFHQLSGDLHQFE
jgi:hypothetical protein